MIQILLVLCISIKHKWEELKKQGRSSNQVNEITEGNLIQAFGVTEDQSIKSNINVCHYSKLQIKLFLYFDLYHFSTWTVAKSQFLVKIVTL